MSNRYREEGRVGPGRRQVSSRPALTAAQVKAVQTLLRQRPNLEASYDITADQDNFKLTGDAIVHRFTTDAARTITGFRALDLDSNVRVIVNVGTQNLVLANDSASSSAQNRILCHTGANITLNQNESVAIFYDRTSSRVRTIGFV